MLAYLLDYDYWELPFLPYLNNAIFFPSYLSNTTRFYEFTKPDKNWLFWFLIHAMDVGISMNYEFFIWKPNTAFGIQST